MGGYRAHAHAARQKQRGARTHTSGGSCVTPPARARERERKRWITEMVSEKERESERAPARTQKERLFPPPPSETKQIAPLARPRASRFTNSRPHSTKYHLFLSLSRRCPFFLPLSTSSLYLLNTRDALLLSFYFRENRERSRWIKDRSRCSKTRKRETRGDGKTTMH